MGEDELLRVVSDFKSLGKSVDTTFVLLRLNIIDEYGMDCYRRNEGLLKSVIRKVYQSGGSSFGKIATTY